MPTTATLTPANLSNVLTTLYFPKMYEEIKVEAAGFQAFKDRADEIAWGEGNTGSFPVRRMAKGGSTGGVSGRLPQGDRATYSTRTFGYPIWRFLVQFLWDSELRGKHERYIKRVVEMAVQDVKMQHLRKFNTYLYGSSIADCGTHVAGGAGTVILADNGLTNSVGIVHTAVDRLNGNAALRYDGTAASPLRIVHPWTNGSDAPTANTIDTNLPFGGQWIEPGDWLALTGVVGGAATAEFRQVVSVTRDYGTNAYADVVLDAQLLANYVVGSPIYFAGANAGSTATFVPTTAANGELIDCYQNAPTATAGGGARFDGLANFTRDASPYGTARAAYWDSEVQGNSGTLRTLDQSVIDGLLLGMNERFFVAPDLLMMQSGMWEDYIDIASANYSFFNQQTADAGHIPRTKSTYAVTRATMSQGDVDILRDKYAPHRTLIACDTDNMGYAIAHQMSEAKEDGSFLRHSETNYDTWSGWLRWAGQFMTYTPAAVGVLKDITQTTTTL